MKGMYVSALIGLAAFIVGMIIVEVSRQVTVACGAKPCGGGRF